MARKLKVYGWQSWRNDCEPAPNGSRQTREICAATSMAAAARAAGYQSARQLFNICETGNDIECAVALAEPGVVFWCSLNRNRANPSDYRRAPTAGGEQK